MDLTLVSNQELLAELDKRFQATVFASWRDLGKKDDYDYHISGNKLMCGQLARLVSRKIENDFIAEDTDNYDFGT